MRYIIFGGAFDPIHTDHLNKASQVLDATGYDRLLFMPTYKHIWDKKTADPAHRVAMIYEALSDFADHRIWSTLFEIVYKVKGPTIDTLKMLFKSEIYDYITPDNTAYLIGMDQAIVIDRWERWEELINLIPFLVMTRGGRLKADWFLKPPHRYVNVTGTDISSSDIRQDIKNNRLNPEHLTSSTLTYIKEHELYV
ncbi:hypothetical protein LCGC14_1568970 [marine sediment metagenome]|uniref:Cytidyltransferase-like domain-containing protein n=1 Tax=marine sediment metagenome TaxID=412755 RepID=A0A0F9IKA5_9ZZZZ